jgi:hypothetical protein
VQARNADDDRRLSSLGLERIDSWQVAVLAPEPWLHNLYVTYRLDRYQSEQQRKSTMGKFVQLSAAIRKSPGFQIAWNYM